MSIASTDGMRRIAKDLPLGRLIRVIDDPMQLEEELRSVRGAYDVKDFLRQSTNGDGSVTDKIASFLKQGLSNCIADIPFEVAKARGESISVSREKLERAAESIDLTRMAEQFAKNPDWKPRRKSGSVNGADQTERMLSESLIGGNVQ